MKAKTIAALIKQPLADLPNGNGTTLNLIAHEDLRQFVELVVRDYAGGGDRALSVADMEELSVLGESKWIDFRLEIAIDELSEAEFLIDGIPAPESFSLMREFLNLEVTEEHEGLELGELFQTFVQRKRMEWLEKNVREIIAPAWAELF